MRAVFFDACVCCLVSGKGRSVGGCMAHHMWRDGPLEMRSGRNSPRALKFPHKIVINLMFIYIMGLI